MTKLNMLASRPVIAFALLRQCSEQIQTDLLGGVSILVRPLVSDLAGQIYDARELAQRMAKAYGISLPAAALEAFTDRLVKAGILHAEKTGDGPTRAIYSEQPVENGDMHSGEVEFQEIIDEFLLHASKILAKANKQITTDTLITGFLRHLATLDFSAIRSKPIVKVESDKTIIGPAVKEQIELSAKLADEAAIDSLVASYISNLYENNRGRLSLLAKVADGALGAELVFDLQAPTEVKRLVNTTVIVDSPLVLSFLDLSSKRDKEDTKDFFSQILQSGAKVATFQHSVEEAEGVLTAISNTRHAGDIAYGPAVFRLTDSVYRAFFDSMNGQIARKWSENHFEIIQETAGHFYKNFTAADEESLMSVLRFSIADRVLTRERDARSVAETLRRLGGAHISRDNLASCKYIFVTQNASFQRRAERFLREKGFVGEGEFTPVTTSRYMAGLCWLISGGKSASSPSIAKLLANCSAALQLRPELAERTKRFLLAIDPEKARHFEALMTNERASQYLAEATFGNPDLITAQNVEEIYAEVERRAAEKISKEKDELYKPQLAELIEKRMQAEKTQAELQRKLVEVELKATISQTNVERLSLQSDLLQTAAAVQKLELTAQTSEIISLKETIINSSNSSLALMKQFEHQRQTAITQANRHADKMLFRLRLLAAGLLFTTIFLLNYYDKFITPAFPLRYQPNANLFYIVASAVLGLCGISLLGDFWDKRVLSSHAKFIVNSLPNPFIKDSISSSRALPVKPTARRQKCLACFHSISMRFSSGLYAGR